MSRLTVNERPLAFDMDPQTPLLWALRDAANLTGTKYGCGVGDCGACMVLVDGEAKMSCQMSLAEAEGRVVITIEGLSPDRSHPVQQALVAEQAIQCGFCTPGIAIVAAALLARNADPTPQDIIAAVPNLCRCGVYPRLVGAIGDHGTANRLVDEQAQVSLLLGGPGVIATIALAPLVLGLLYSPEFVPATETLRWICLGMAVRIVTWPVGFVVVAKSRPGAFVAIELAWATINVALSWLLVQRHGPVGAAIALFGSYLVHAAVLYPVVRRMTGFRWSAQTRRTLLLQGFAVAAAFAAWRWLEPTTAATVSALLLAATLAAATRTLLRRVRGR